MVFFFGGFGIFDHNFAVRVVSSRRLYHLVVVIPHPSIGFCPHDQSGRHKTQSLSVIISPLTVFPLSCVVPGPHGGNPRSTAHARSPGHCQYRFQTR